MPGKIFSVAQQKGGAGKTTLAAHLAIAFADLGKSVAVVDIDPQGSLSGWFAARGRRRDQRHGPTVVAVQGWRLQNEVRRLARDHDVVLVDSPPHADTEARIAIRSADLVILPLQPSPMDLWATQKTVEQVTAEGSNAILVLNRVPRRARLTESMVQAIGHIGGRLANSRLGNRIIFAASMEDGLGVTEAKPKSRAAEEVRDLANELLSLAG